MSTYIGPVTVNASFIFGSIQNGIPFILNATSYNNGIIYYWESDYQTLSKSYKIPTFLASGSLNSLILKDNTNQGGMSFRSVDGITIGNSNPPTTIIMSQSTYANWTYPDIFLASATYNIYNTHNALAQVLTDPQATNTIPANNLIVLPLNYYYKCTATSSNYTKTNNPMTAIKNWFCFINPSPSYCNNYTPILGWTDQTDCINGFVYPYCPIDTYCGSTGTCNGPCSDSSDKCNFDDQNTSFVCKWNPTVSTNWLSSMYFIIAIIILGFFTVMGVILVFYLFKKMFTPTSTQNTTTDENTKNDLSKPNYILE